MNRHLSWNTLDDGVSRQEGVVRLLTPLIEVCSVANLNGKLVTRHAKLGERAALWFRLAPVWSCSWVLDPRDEPIVREVSECLLLGRDVLNKSEVLIATKEEWDLGAVSWGRYGKRNDVGVVAHEAIGPGALLLASHIDKVVNRAEESSIAVLSTAHCGDTFKISRIVCGLENIIRNVRGVSIETVDPGIEVGIFIAVNEAEDRALFVCVSSEERNMRSVFSS